MISIQPKWCELIASGRKIVEIRNTRPKLKAPFKCYIYEAKDKYYKNVSMHWHDGKDFMHNIGKVIGEFVCDIIDAYDLPYPAYQSEVSFDLLLKACTSYGYLHSYVGSGGRFYGWHISNLVIYDSPKELSEFSLKRRPRSWCYIKEENND
jgi:predicted transcriptional regulator